jgi:hypothetical protein
LFRQPEPPHAGIAGDRIFSVATALISGVNAFFLSPSLWIMQECGPTQARTPIVATIALAFVLVPIVCAIIGAMRSKSAS